jgi:hypothetical protein
MPALEAAGNAATRRAGIPQNATFRTGYIPSRPLRTSTRFCGVKRMVNRDGVARAPVRRENLAFA